MENTPNNNAFNENIQDTPIKEQPPIQEAEQSNPIYNAPNYDGQYTANFNPSGVAPQGVPYAPPTAYNAPQYTPANTQSFAQSPYSAYSPYAQPQPQSPSMIYTTAQTGNAPQYHYGNPMFGGIIDNRYYYEQQEKLRKRRENEKKIRSIGNISGLALIICLLIATAFSTLLLIPGISKIYYSGLSGQSLINLLYSLAVVGGTFFILGQFLKKVTNKGTGQPKYKIDTKLNAPKDPIKATLLIFISFGGCMLANYLTSIILSIFENYGIYSGYSSQQNPNSISDVILMCIATAVIPPLIEEYAMRGVLMSAHRKYGNIFAIVASAYVFGLFHGNFAQIPFAFICGLFFGYAVIATDSLWTAIIIHALNNALSCISSIIIKAFDEDAGTTFFYVCSIAGIVLGILAFILYIIRYKNNDILKFKGEAEELPTKTKLAKFLTSPVMIVATVIYLIQAIIMLTTTPPTT